MKGIFLGFFILVQTFVFKAYASEVSYCSEVGRWAEAMAFVKLKNNKEISLDEIYQDKTSMSLISEEKIGDDLYVQVHLITYYKKSGDEIKVISVNEASSEECSMNDVDVYLVKAKF